MVVVSPESLIAQSGNPATEGPPPAFKHCGGRFDVFCFNERKGAVHFSKMSSSGEPECFGTIEVGAQMKQTAGPGEVWQTADLFCQPLGHFVFDDRSAHAIIMAV